MTTDTAEFWKGTFGDEYLKRNRVDWRGRIPFWQGIMDRTGARSVFEFGCNAGWNLSAIRRAYLDVMVYGSDINKKAMAEATSAGLEVGSGPGEHTMFDLTFTAGVLIHIAPADLESFMRNIVKHSNRWVLAVEYEGIVDEEVEYRGHAGKLWKRPYGPIYGEMGLDIVWHGEARGFDDCTFWLMEKK